MHNLPLSERWIISSLLALIRRRPRYDCSWAVLPYGFHTNLYTGSLYTGSPRFHLQAATRILPRVQGTGRLPAAELEAAHIIGAPPVLDLLS